MSNQQRCANCDCIYSEHRVISQRCPGRETTWFPGDLAKPIVASPAPRELSAERLDEIDAWLNAMKSVPAKLPVLATPMSNALQVCYDLRHHLSALTAKLEAAEKALEGIALAKGSRPQVCWKCGPANGGHPVVYQYCHSCKDAAESFEQRTNTAEADNANLREAMRGVQSLLHFYGKREMENPSNNQEAVRDTREALDKFDAALTAPAAPLSSRTGFICAQWKRLSDGCVARCDKDAGHEGRHLDSLIAIGWEAAPAQEPKVAPEKQA